MRTTQMSERERSPGFFVSAVQLTGIRVHRPYSGHLPLLRACTFHGVYKLPAPELACFRGSCHRQEKCILGLQKPSLALSSSLTRMACKRKLQSANCGRSDLQDYKRGCVQSNLLLFTDFNRGSQRVPLPAPRVAWTAQSGGCASQENMYKVNIFVKGVCCV